MGEMERIKFSISESLKAKLQECAEAQGVSMSDVIRLAVTEYVRKTRNNTFTTGGTITLKENYWPPDFE